MYSFKESLKHTFLYEIVKQHRVRKLAQQWTRHDQEMLDFYSQFVSPNDICFDVGANIGNRTKIFLQLGANVVAVEPQIECVKLLQVLYGKTGRLTIIPKVLGAVEGQAELMVSNANTISSLSREWIEAVRSSGRFSGYSWKQKQLVPMTTLDILFKRYGTPAFMKIDVEGFEYEVIRGMSQPVGTLSLEFVPEIIENAFKCIDYLQSLGSILLNYSLGETMRLILNEWITVPEMFEILAEFRGDHPLFGDVYVKFPK